ncbi:hypothetical protein FXO38_01461 [Capsicum annuum]|nr:hypothetical protein FXO38_01461 [Capsicum annuum]
MGTCFGQYANMLESWVQSQIFRCAMSLELKTSSTDAILLRFNENTLRFSLRDFAIISSLNCVACKGDFVFDTSVPNRLMQTDFDGEEEPYEAMLFQAFEDIVWGQNDDDAFKISILYFIHYFIMSDEMHTVRVPTIHFDVVEHERYMDSCWGKEAFEELAKSISRKLTSDG